jgi:hypothetical protein
MEPSRDLERVWEGRVEHLGGAEKHWLRKIYIFFGIFVLLLLTLPFSLSNLRENILSSVLSGHNRIENDPFTSRATTVGDQYLLGVGKADVTGYANSFHKNFLSNLWSAQWWN